MTSFCGTFRISVKTQNSCNPPCLYLNSSAAEWISWTPPNSMIRSSPFSKNSLPQPSSTLRQQTGLHSGSLKSTLSSRLPCSAFCYFKTDHQPWVNPFLTSVLLKRMEPPSKDGNYYRSFFFSREQTGSENDVLPGS